MTPNALERTSSADWVKDAFRLYFRLAGRSVWGVRPMRAPVRIVMLWCCAAITSCTPFQMATYTFPGIILEGPYSASLTTADVRQILELGRNLPNIKHPVYRIDVQHPGEAEITSGRTENTGDSQTTFTVRKGGAGWKVIQSSISTREVIITG
jgi:hypothetical protein